jgi:hypothetical protein
MLAVPTITLRRFLERIRDRPRMRRVLIEGDSWFSFPGIKGGNLAGRIAGRYRNRAVALNIAEPGDIAGRMLNELSQETLATLLRRYRFDALLFSGGGNDLVGEHFDDYLKRANQPQDAPLPPGAPGVVADHLRLRAFADALDHFRERLRALCARRDEARPGCPIFVHTYDYAIPDGRPVVIGPIRRGPWLRPSLERAGVPERERGVLVAWMVDAFAAMLLDLETREPGFHVVDSRGVLTDVRDWNDELHPTGAGFRRILVERWAPLLDPLFAAR